MDLANSSLISQAGQMQTGGLPNDLLYNLNPIAVMILLPLLQGVVYPLLQGRFGISISPERRIIAGLVCAAISMGYAAGVQALVYAAGPCYSHPRHCDRDGASSAAAPPNDVSVWLQTPTYVFFALCEILTLVAGLELAYLRAPPSMKSIVQAVFILFSAAGAVVGVGVSFVAADPNMHILYASLAGAMLATASGFLVFVLAKGRRPNST
jgi:POT family proton-dependent oligopeptide transporter